MKMKEVETRTGLDRKNIRYYCNFSYRIQIKATSNPYNSLNPLTWSESP